MIRPTAVCTLASLAIFGALAGPAQAEPVAPAPSDEIAQPKAKPEEPAEKKICRSITITGTRIPQKMCKTKADWDAMTEQNQDELRDRQRSDRSWRPDAG